MNGHLQSIFDTLARKNAGRRGAEFEYTCKTHSFFLSINETYLFLFFLFLW